MSCIFCKSDLHTHVKCPMFGRIESFLKAYAPSVALEGPVNKPRPSFARTQLEQLYGGDHESILSQALDDPDLEAEQQSLAMDILNGSKKLGKLDASDTALMDSLVQHTYNSGGARKNDSQARVGAKVLRLPVGDSYVDDEYVIDDLRPYSPK